MSTAKNPGKTYAGPTSTTMTAFHTRPIKQQEDGVNGSPGELRVRLYWRR